MDIVFGVLGLILLTSIFGFWYLAEKDYKRIYEKENDL